MAIYHRLNPWAKKIMENKKMNLEDKKEKVMEAIDDLDWSDSRTPEVMEGFINSPIEAIEHLEGKMSEDHIDHLFELLDCEEDEEE
jgi:hypothetical protein